MESFVVLITKIILQNILLSSVVSILCFVVVTGHFYYKNVFTYWHKRGVKGPKPVPILGNMHTILFNNHMELEKRWAKEYGKVYGIYRGSKPMLVVADPEVMRQVSIKDFDSLPNHEFKQFYNKYQKSFLIILKDDHWKRVRALISPTFTSGRIRKMFKILDNCADDLVQCFSEQLLSGDKKRWNQERESIVNLKNAYNLYTMDGITTCLYGLKLERAGSTDLKTAATRDELIRVMPSIFNVSITRVLFLITAPIAFIKWVGFEGIPSKSFEPLANIVQRMIDRRRNSLRKPHDYLQLLIDAKLEDMIDLDELDHEENHHAGLTHESLVESQKKLVQDVLKGDNSNAEKSRAKIGLTDMEILCSAILFLWVGLDTTSNLLAHCSYALAFHSEIQEKLYEELKRIAIISRDTSTGKSRFEFEYDTLTSCHYLDSVISETLRILSPVLLTDRVLDRDLRIGKYNIDLPKGSLVLLSIYALGNDPDYWEEPEIFRPERFMPENKAKIVPGSYCPFGIGPRHCIGMRFSLTESKIALAKTVMNFRFEPAPNTRFPPEPKRSLINFNNIKNPSVQIIPRA